VVHSPASNFFVLTSSVQVVELHVKFELGQLILGKAFLELEKKPGMVGTIPGKLVVGVKLITA